MLPGSRSLLLLGACCLLLAGCGSSSSGSMSGTLNGGAGNGSTGGNPPGNPIGGVSGPTGTNNTVVATPSIAGTISVVVGAPQTISITFTSSDGNAITGFGVSGTTLPAGWSGPSTFACAKVATGSGCVLNLTYAPVAAGSGTLTLDFVFVNNAGTPNTRGSASFAYVATTHDSIVGSPSQNPAAVYTGGTISVGVTFTTDDGNIASSLLVTGGLTALPAGWSGASSFLCAAVSTGNGCRLDLTYAPTVLDSGTLSLNYSYLDNSGTAKTGSVDIPYAATVPHLYVAQLSGTLSSCVLNSDGTLASCAATGIGIQPGTFTAGIAFNGSSFAYVADYDNSSVYLCNVALDGSLSGCASTGSNFNSPWHLAINGSTLYATNANAMGGVTTCTIAADGTLSGCTQTVGTGTTGIAVSPAYAYFVKDQTTVDVCAVGIAGSLSGCASTGSGFTGLDGIFLSGGYAYAANTGNGTVSACMIDAIDGTLSGCAASSVGTMPMDVVTNGSQAYVDDTAGDIYLCAVSAGALSGCVISDGGATFSLPIQIAIH